MKKSSNFFDVLIEFGALGTCTNGALNTVWKSHSSGAFRLHSGGIVGHDVGNSFSHSEQTFKNLTMHL